MMVIIFLASSPTHTHARTHTCTDHMVSMKHVTLIQLYNADKVETIIFTAENSFSVKCTEAIIQNLYNSPVHGELGMENSVWNSFEIGIDADSFGSA